ncbi:metal-dependent hydrolase [Candidatus Woesearchaeota archaeon]|nr:metal-dependent hydrolase [Candidatus Woesearchaeota archaeon]
MMGRTHMAIGFLAGLALFKLFDSNPLLFICLATLGSLLPDLDHEKSMINRLLPVTRWIPWLFRHRGFFHSIFPALIILFAGLIFSFQMIALPLAIGYLVHLFSDCLTRQGCNLLHPFSTFRIQGFLVTGGLVEFVILGIVLVLDVLILARFAGLV